MPKTPIDIACSIEHLAILDEDGRVDPDLDPHLSEELLTRLYRAMLLGRRFDERLLNLQRQGRVGTFPPTTGHEAAHLGVVAAIGDDDWMVPAFRETPAELFRGKSLESVLLNTAGFNQGAPEPAINNLPMSVPVGSQVLHAVGIAWAMKYRREKSVAVCFFGDGATSQGDFHEGLNFAGVFQVPVIFVCQNNQWAISVPVSRQTHAETLVQKAIAYGIEAIQVDGNDVLAVYTAAAAAAERARQGKGPTLIECVTYRLIMHTTADDPRRYRSDEEVAIWKRRDPLIRFGKYLLRRGVFTPQQIEALETSVKEEIQTAVERAEARMQTLADPLSMFDHTYARMPPHIEAQKNELARELEAEQKGGVHG